VRLRSFDPGSRWFGLRVNVLRRMHRKIVVVDAERAFVGGINYSADHLADFGPQAKQDYAVELRGPVVEEIHRFAAADAAGVARRPARWWRRDTADHHGVHALFVTRDNQEHRNASSASTALPSGARASACSSPMPISSPAIGCCAKCAAPRDVASTCT
jgi:cardiolipin synthase A/B